MENFKSIDEYRYLLYLFGICLFLSFLSIFIYENAFWIFLFIGISCYVIYVLKTLLIL